MHMRIANFVSISFVAVAGLALAGCSKPTKSEPVTVPVLTTAPVTSITQTTARGGGEISSDGGSKIGYWGICWSTDSLPTISDRRTSQGPGSWTFEGMITDLSPGTDYYVRAYAKNPAGVGYGNVESFTTEAYTGTVTDIDGNTYNTIRIGSQMWIAENLRVTRYRNGDSIPNIVSNSDSLSPLSWSNQTAGSYCAYNNDESLSGELGMLYNWYAAADLRGIAPAGWHVPTKDEFDTLLAFLQGASVAGEKMKDAAFGGTNESGFTALSAGCRTFGHPDKSYYDFYGKSAQTAFWTSTDSGLPNAWAIRLLSHFSDCEYLNADVRSGFSIRCIANH